jgi:hypothetical protein
MRVAITPVKAYFKSSAMRWSGSSGRDELVFKKERRL